jgi:hypothetical protein
MITGPATRRNPDEARSLREPAPSNLAAWPRFLQVAALGFMVAGAVFATARVLAPVEALALIFLALAGFFFGNFAAYQLRAPNYIVSPATAGLATYGCLAIAVLVLVS